MLKKVLFLSLIILMISSYAPAEEENNIVGLYDTLPGQSFIFDGKQVEVMEFLSFYCGHCFQFEKSIPVIKGNFPKKIKWKVMPIYWGKGSSKPGEAYLIAVDQGKGEQMKKALFESFFLEKQDIGKIEVLEGIGMNIGMGFDFSKKLRSGEKAEAAKKAVEMARSYGVKETPTLIIAGNIKTSPGKVNNNVNLLRDNTLLIIKSILDRK